MFVVKKIDIFSDQLNYVDFAGYKSIDQTTILHCSHKF